MTEQIIVATAIVLVTLVVVLRGGRDVALARVEQSTAVALRRGALARRIPGGVIRPDHPRSIGANGARTRDKTMPSGGVCCDSNWSAVPPGPVHVQPQRIVVSGTPVRRALAPTVAVPPIPHRSSRRHGCLNTTHWARPSSLVGFVVVFITLLPVGPIPTVASSGDRHARLHPGDRHSAAGWAGRQPLARAAPTIEARDISPKPRRAAFRQVELDADRAAGARLIDTEPDSDCDPQADREAARHGRRAAHAGAPTNPAADGGSRLETETAKSPPPGRPRRQQPGSAFTSAPGSAPATRADHVRLPSYQHSDEYSIDYGDNTRSGFRRSWWRRVHSTVHSYALPGSYHVRYDRPVQEGRCGAWSAVNVP